MNLQSTPRRLPNPYATTTWRNDTAATQMFKIHGNHGYKLENMERGVPREPVQTVILKPGESIQLPSHLDRAIQTIGSCLEGCPNTYCTGDHGGIIIGGMAPMLTKVGRTISVERAKDIDPAEAEKRFAAAAKAWEEAKKLAETAAFVEQAKQGLVPSTDAGERAARAETEADNLAARARREPGAIILEGNAADSESEITESELNARVEGNRGRGQKSPRRE